jgi:outer membrane protein assembly factor BamB
LIVEHNDRVQVVVNATNLIRSYDLADSSLIWQFSRMTRGTISAPVYADGVIYVMSGFQGAVAGECTDSTREVRTLCLCADFRRHNRFYQKSRVGNLRSFASSI